MAEAKKQPKKTYTPEQTAAYRKSQQDKKETKAKEKNTVVVYTETFEAAETTQFIDKMDYTMKKLRLTFSSRRSNVSATQFEQMTGFVGGINNMINLFLCQANKLAGIPYRPPRGYADLSKQSNLTKASDELEHTIEILLAEKVRIDKQIESYNKKQSEIAENSTAKQTAAAKKTPVKAKSDSGIESAAA